MIFLSVFISPFPFHWIVNSVPGFVKNKPLLSQGATWPIILILLGTSYPALPLLNASLKLSLSNLFLSSHRSRKYLIVIVSVHFFLLLGKWQTEIITEKSFLFCIATENLCLFCQFLSLPRVGPSPTAVFYWLLNVNLLLHLVPDPGRFNIFIKALPLTSESTSIYMHHKKHTLREQKSFWDRNKPQKCGLTETQLRKQHWKGQSQEQSLQQGLGDAPGLLWAGEPRCSQHSHRQAGADGSTSLFHMLIGHLVHRGGGCPSRSG